MIYIVRHGQSEANRDRIVCGQMDSPLTDLGIQQALETKTLLQNIKFDAAYSSDLQRSLKTTEIIAGFSVPETHQLPTLRERTFGKLEGQPDNLWAKIYEKFEHQYGGLPRAEKWSHRYAPDIESNGELSARFLKAVCYIGGKHLGQTVLIGSHAGCIRTTLITLGYADESRLPPNSFANSAYVVLSFDGHTLAIEKVTGVL